MTSLALLERTDVGSPAWWQDVAAAGTPLRAPRGEHVELAFLWRGTDCAAVYLDVYSHTPHPVSQRTALMRLGGTDVWVWRTTLPADWRGSYFLLPVQGGQEAPTERRAVRAWWIDLMTRQACADPFNRLPAHGTGWGVPLSPLLLPQAPVHPAWQVPAAADGMTCRRWHSTRLDVARDVWVIRTGPVHVPLPLVVLLDGQYWAREMPVAGALHAMTAQGALPPAVYVLIDAVSPERRGVEMPCNEAFWLAVQEELLPWVQPFERSPADTVVAGQSYGGLAALYAALRFPDCFGCVLSQSGSFWWPDPARTEGEGWLAEQVNGGLGNDARIVALLEVGCYETEMTGVNGAMAAALARAGHTVHYTVVRGGHDPLCWRDGLLDGLARLLNKTP
ncbi:enterochelin esterase [Pseudoduganella plicata]|uniref:Enterochelin esterase n=1 Tax=Pseudoduganella plicata TaxID=321984 RepID=A0A4P7B8V9_9BURK|nr:enterochelin esterase [Pseudoduganella plicata]QBQ34911.1 enterochelin esterase [Pseudoduganella plicata]GGY89561.1 enterochelin esterase [Pseudoduganella plicata]